MKILESEKIKMISFIKNHAMLFVLGGSALITIVLWTLAIFWTLAIYLHAFPVLFAFYGTVFAIMIHEMHLADLECSQRERN